MAKAVRDPEVAAALTSARAALVALHGQVLTPVDVDDANALVVELEGIGRLVGAAQHVVLSEVQRCGVHRDEGHVSAKVLVRHVARLSDGEAARRERVRRALVDLPAVLASWVAGRIGLCQVQLIARVWANERVRAALVDQDAAAARLAERLSYRALVLQLRTWERLVDQDGAEDRARSGHERRNSTMHQDFDGNWSGAWNCGALEGAVRRSIMEAFEQAEYEADWAKARADLGDEATQADLARSDAQRRSDALGEIFRCAADHHAAVPGGAPIVTNVVIDQATFEDQLHRWTGADPAPVDLRLDPDGESDRRGEPGGGELNEGGKSRPGAAGANPAKSCRPWSEHHPVRDERPDQPDPARVPSRPAGNDGRPGRKPSQDQHESKRPDDPAADGGQSPGGSPPPGPSPRPWTGRRSSTLDGHPIPPAEILAAALCGEVRRAVIGAGSVVIDLGRRQRLFTGPAAAALKLQLDTCAWPGCHVPVTACQGDHLIPWNSGGSTSPGNGAPLCGRHNRTKEQGYRIIRDQLGDLHVHCPDGIEIT